MGMSSTSLASTLEETTSLIARTDRVTKRVVRWVITPAYWMLYVVCVWALALAVVALWRATQNGIWHNFWSKLRVPFFSSDGPVLWLYLALCGSLVESYSQDTLRIREAALAADDHLAPLAETQPDGTLAPDLPGESVIVGALRRPRGGFADTRRLASLSFAIMFAVFALVFFALLIAIPSTGARVIFAVFLALCAPVALLFRRMRRRTKTTVRVWASAAGLEWETEKRYTVAWREIQAFMTYRRGDKAAHPGSAIYAVEMPQGMLTWEIPTDASEDERRAHDRLAGFVANYAGLPLRDLSNSAELLTDEEPTDACDEPAPVEPDRVPVVRNPRVSQERGCHPNLGCLSFLILYGVVLLLALAGVILQHV